MFISRHMQPVPVCLSGAEWPSVVLRQALRHRQEHTGVESLEHSEIAWSRDLGGMLTATATCPQEEKDWQ